MSEPRAFFGAVEYGGAIYVAGGYDGKNELSSALVYRWSKNAWEPLAPLSVARGGLSLISDGRDIFALGGGWTAPIDTHERFDPETRLWTNFLSPLSDEWRNLAVISHDGSLHLIGGWSGDYVNTHLRYRSSVTRLLLPIIQTN
jgi:hypothetical protein